MKKVFIYFEKFFYVENGVDIMAALDDDKVKIFCSKDEALDYLKKNVEICRDLNPGVRKFRFADNNRFCVTLKSPFRGNKRFVFEIIGKDLY